MQFLSVTLRLAAAITTLLVVSVFGNDAGAQSISNGRQLYITPLVSGQFSCSNGQCHGPTPANNQNKILSAANDPDRIGFAIGTVAQMAFLRNNVTGSQLADLAAYIGNPAGANGPIAEIAPDQFAFASTVVGATSASQPFVLSNTGNAPLVVSAVTSNNPEFAVTSSCISVAAGGNCTVTASFAPSATGARSAVVTITHNAGSATTVALSGTGVAVPGAQVSSPLLAFGAILVGSLSGSQQFAITNNGSAPLAISGVTSDRLDFPLLGGTCVAGGSVAVNASCSVVVRFAPTSAGARTGNVIVSHNAAGGSSVVMVTGTGVSMAFEKRTMVEYIYTPLNYYFMTSRDADKVALDGIAAFQRTGQSFAVYAAPETGTKGITRFYFDKVALNGARGSHFYTLVDSEKAALAQLNPGNAALPRLPFDEGIDSYAFLPAVEGVGGSCAAGQVPVFRLFRGNVRFPDDPNHRFTTSTAIYNEFVALGWDGEGVKFCAPTP